MWDKILSLFGIKTIRLTFIGHEREGGYVFITSPELPGFTFMLAPGEAENIRTFINAIDEPLDAYLDAYFGADKHDDRMQIMGIRQSKPMNYVAEVCPA